MSEEAKKSGPPAQRSVEGGGATVGSFDAGDDAKAQAQANEVAELVKDMPQPVRRRFEMTMMQMFSGGSGPMMHPLFEKFTDKHIDKFLDISQKDDQNQFHFHSTNRWFRLAYAAIAVAVFVFILIFFAKDQQTLNEILKLLVIFGGGVGSGYGLRSLKDRK